MADGKFGAEVTDISCKRVEIGTVKRADGTVEPIFDVRPHAPEAYRRLISIVTNDGHHTDD